MRTYYVSGSHPEIMYPYPIAHHLDTDTGTDTIERPDMVMDSHDLRVLGLGPASDRLSMNVADLDVVHVARAKADTRMCPVCPFPHPA